MSCFLDTEEGKVRAVLMFKRSQLLYDIKNYAYIEGSVLGEDVDVHNRHMVQDVGEAGNVDRVNRVLDLSMAKCREMLYPFTKHAIHTAELDNVLREPDIYGIVMDVPEDFSQTTLNLLEQLIHEYLVCTAVAEWMSMTNPGKFEVWMLKAQEAESQIRVCLNVRVSKMRRTLKPF